eukprot:4241370-Amphidinium_carterae.1
MQLLHIARNPVAAMFHMLRYNIASTVDKHFTWQHPAMIEDIFSIVVETLQFRSELNFCGRASMHTFSWYPRCHARSGLDKARSHDSSCSVAWAGIGVIVAGVVSVLIAPTRATVKLRSC